MLTRGSTIIAEDLVLDGSEHVRVLTTHTHRRYRLARTPKFGTSGFCTHVRMLPCFMMLSFSFDVIDFGNAGALAFRFISGNS